MNGEFRITICQERERGCPNCSSFRSEKIVRKTFKDLFGEEFPKRRPKVLKGLELDGYNKSHKLAFEFNGYQNYRYIPFLLKKWNI